MRTFLVHNTRNASVPKSRSNNTVVWRKEFDDRYINMHVALSCEMFRCDDYYSVNSLSNTSHKVFRLAQIYGFDCRLKHLLYN